MASSYSQLNSLSGQPLFTFGNKELLRLGMASMQERVDFNRQKLSQLQEQLSLNIDLARDVDKQYFQDRLQQVTDIVNQSLLQGDITNPAFSSQLVSKLKESVDERVYNGVASTMLRNNSELSEWKDAKKKNPDKYSDLNFAYQSQNWNEYLNSTDPNAVYRGGGGFIAYDDYNKRLVSPEFQKILKDSGINAKYVVREDGSGYFDYVNTIEGTVDKQRLKEVVATYLGDSGVKQMEINAWGRFGDINNPQTVESIRNIYNSTIEKQNQNNLDEIRSLESLISSTPEGIQKEQLKNRLQDTTEQYNSTKYSTFDSDVTDVNGYIDPNKYKNLYTSFYKQQEVERLTSLSEQKPRIVETKVEDVKLQVAKFNETVRHNQANELLGAGRLEIAREQLELNKVKAGIGGVANSTNVQNQDTVLGTLQQVSDEQRGKVDLRKNELDAQSTAIKNVNDLVGGAMGAGDTAKLIETLAGTNIGDLSEINIAGRNIKITPENRATILPILDNFKKTLVDGGSSSRLIRNEYSKTIENVTNDLISHYSTNASDQRDLDFAKENFYFEKDQNGQYIYKTGLMPGAKTSNYKLLMYKASKNGINSLTPNDRMTLQTYATRGVVSDKGFNLSEYDGQQMYRALQENIVTTLGSAKAVNTMPAYSQVAPQKSPTVGRIIAPPGTVGLSTSGATIQDLEQTLPAIFSTRQDTQLSGIGATDGKGNLQKTISNRLNSVSTLYKEALEDKSREIGYTPVNISKGTASAKYLENKLAINLKNQTPQLLPEIVNGRPTDMWEVYYDVTTGYGKEKKTERVPAKDLNGNVVKLSSKELGLNVADYYGSTYNSDLGNRASSVKLGGGR